jgi:hypothetical protein
MPIHTDENCNNTTEYCRIEPDCQGCRYCCGDHAGTCEDCRCTDTIDVGVDSDCDCPCHSEPTISDEELRRAERRQMGIT